MMTKHSEQIRKFIKMGSNSSILLLSLVEDILNLSKIEGGVFTITCANFKLKEILDEVYDIFHFQCTHKNIGLELKLQREIEELLIYSDAVRIKQVLLNLLANSYKFTFKGKITLEVRLTTLKNKPYVQFSVIDTGIGIKEEHLPNLFQLFARVNYNDTGCGIGLTVSKKYIQHLKGCIDIRSKFGEGTQVRFVIPLIKPLSLLVPRQQNSDNLLDEETERQCDEFESREIRVEDVLHSTLNSVASRDIFNRS